mmetsp:Transcript_15932/g.54058  ORF Transcript_15932/g.54058 Transcript_15932/m.54058 type:complete len:96 (-) Transcript_15932:170-457(-)
MEWVEVNGSSPELQLTFGTSGSAARAGAGGFAFSFYADGPSNGCGALSSPARLEAASMVVTDGSASWSTMAASQSYRLELTLGAHSSAMAESTTT